MRYRVKQDAAADAGIVAQVDWYRADERRGGEVLAKRWVDALHKALRTLEEAPTQHRFAPENGKWMPEFELRQLLFRPWKSDVGWRVLYTIDEKAKTVTVLQVRHERRRYRHEGADEDAG